VRRKARGFAVEFTLAAPAFRASRDRAALEEIARRAGELRTMHPVENQELAFEGELSWERLPWAVAQGGPLTLYRLAREGVIVAAERPVKGALGFDRAPEPLPRALLASLQPGLVLERA
jgi:hypothetical protein